MPIKVAEMIRLLEADGWRFKYQRGSHRYFVHPTKPGKITVAGTGSATLKPGTEAAILRQAGISGRDR
jgi:predicted RNA binding protein YcfA (HicA-like mRNA interferase family)